MTLADQIRTRRTAKGLSKAELARQAKVSKAYIGQLEDPSRKSMPSYEVIDRIALVLGTTIGALMEKTVGIEDEEEIIPEPLRRLAIEENLQKAEVLMLSRIRYRGQQPSTKKDWWFLLESIKRACSIEEQ
jgi:transcriptional regulator with XRE-family HTH domain